jgi:hypothetical protein
MIQERFNNKKQIRTVECPVWFLHGLNDEVIGYHHSQSLQKECGANYTMLSLQKEMTHNVYFEYEDLTMNMERFFEKIKYSEGPAEECLDIRIFDDYKDCPINMQCG